ncbi:MAG: hypothetical protein H0X26_00580 [Alphaproteobacteria bacterium]|nr:hypothetical protein [Alphaproteobacteria bacterium]
MNVINLKTLSLSALMASSMLSSAFAMEPEIDGNSQISSVRAAREKFQSPVKTDTQGVKIDFKKDLDNAQEGGVIFLQKKIKMQQDAELRKQTLQNDIREINDTIPVRKQVLQNLLAEVKETEIKIVAFNNKVLITKDGPISYLNPWAYFSGDKSIVSPHSNAIQDNQVVEEEAPIQLSKTLENLALEENKTNTENVIYANELSIIKEKDELELLELQRQLSTLENEIAAAKKAVVEQTVALEQAEKKYQADEKNALLTRDMLPSLPSLSSLSPTKWYNSSPTK